MKIKILRSVFIEILEKYTELLYKLNLPIMNLITARKFSLVCIVYNKILNARFLLFYLDHFINNE